MDRNIKNSGWQQGGKSYHQKLQAVDYSWIHLRNKKYSSTGYQLLGGYGNGGSEGWSLILVSVGDVPSSISATLPTLYNLQ